MSEVPEYVLVALEEVRASGKTNMSDRRAVTAMILTQAPPGHEAERRSRKSPGQRAAEILAATLAAISNPDRWCPYGIQDAHGHVLAGEHVAPVARRCTFEWLEHFAGGKRTAAYRLARAALEEGCRWVSPVLPTCLDYHHGREASITALRRAIRQRGRIRAERVA